MPTIDLSAACHGQEKGLPTEAKASAYHDCMQAEQQALGDLRQKWAGFPAAAKQPCAALAQTFDSYVELLVCIEIRAGTPLDTR
jgi:hypothetical protein